MSEQKYVKPEILPGDLIECVETGGMGIIREIGNDRGSYSITQLPGARIKSAWWSRSEFRVVKQGPAHEYWQQALEVQKAQDEHRERESDIDWVIAHWDPEANFSQSSVIAVLNAAGLMPDQFGLLMRGEIGLAALATLETFRHWKPLIDEAMKAEDPKSALAAIQSH